MKIKIVSIDDCPVTDNYSRPNLTFARIYLYKRGDAWCVSIDQDEDMVGTPAEWYFNTAGIRERLEFTPSKESAQEFLSSEEAQRLLSAVVESFSVEWDGSNHVGEWDYESWQEFINLLHQECIETDWTHYTLGDYYEPCFPYDKIRTKALFAKSFKKAIDEVVAEEESEHLAHKICVEGDLAEFFERVFWEECQDIVIDNVAFVDTDFLAEKVIEFANQYLSDDEIDSLDEAKKAILSSL